MIARIILAEAEKDACKPWGRKIKTPIAKLRLIYAYNFELNTTLVAAILKELGTVSARLTT